MHNLLKDKEPNGIPHPASVRSEQAESIKSDGNASQHRCNDSEMHPNVDPLEEANCSGYAQENYSKAVR